MADSKPTQKPTTATKATTSGTTAIAGPIVVGHGNRLRMWLAALCGVIAVVLVLASILAVWLNRTLTDTATYVNTVAPLLEDEDIQEFLATQATGNLLKDAPPEELAAVVLPEAQRVGKTPEQLKAESTRVINDSVRKIIANEQFQALWRDTNRNVHGQLVGLLQGKSDTVTLDLGPVVQNLVNQMKTTELASVADKITLPEQAGKLTLFGTPASLPGGAAIPPEAEKALAAQQQVITKARDYYQLQKQAIIILVGVAILAVAGCVALSVQHMRTLRRILIIVGALTLGLAAILQLPLLVKMFSPQPEPQAIAAFSLAIFHDLKVFLSVFGASCIVAAIASKIYSVSQKRRLAPPVRK